MRLDAPEGADPAEDPRAAAVLGRRAAAARGDRRAGLRRRRGWAGCRSPITSGPDPRRCISSCASTGGWCRRTTSSPGFPGAEQPGRVGRARQPPRRLGQRRRGSGLRARRAARGGAGVRRAAQAGLAAAAHHRARRCGTARSRCSWAPPSGPRPTRTSWRARRSPTSTPTATAAAASAPTAPPRSARLVSEVARDVTDPETGMSVWKRSHLGEIAAAARSAERRKEARERSDLVVDPDGLRLRLHGLLPSPRHSVAQPGFGGEDDGGDLPLHLRQLPLVHHVQRHGLRLRPRAGADGRPRDHAAGLRRRAAVRVRPPVRAGERQPQGGPGPAHAGAGLDRGAEPPGRREHIRGDERPAPAPVAPAQREPVPPFLNFAPLQNGAARLKSATPRFESRLRRGA